MAADGVRQGFDGDYHSGGHQFVGSTINAGSVHFGPGGSTAKHDLDPRCLRDLLVTDPRVERTRILDSKDDLLEGSCDWVLTDPAFVDWWNNDDIRILWIHGDPGKGKTMMAMALIEEISRRLGISSVENKGGLTYFFCQGTIDGLNDAVSVVRGLIYMLVDERRELLHHVAKVYETEGSRLFEGSYGLHALWRLLCNVLQDALLPRVYLVIDALDECGAHQAELLRLVTRYDGASCSKVKLLITSRNERQIQERLDDSDHVCHTSLEIHSRHVSDAVRAFIDIKTRKLRKYDEPTRKTIEKYLHNHADGTFLWVALVCKELEKTPVWKTQSVLEKYPRGLEPLYERMLGQIWRLEDKKDIEYCRKVLCAVILVYRPLHLNELVFTANLPDEFSNNLVAIQELVALCGSFLTIRDDIVYFVHQSARDYLNGAAGSPIFPLGQLYEHKRLAHRSLGLISSVLKTDMCGLEQPGTLREDIDADWVSRCIAEHVQYACCYWMDHLLGKPSSSTTLTDLAPLDQSDNRPVYQFFSQDFLHWLEALSLMGKISEGILAVVALESRLVNSHVHQNGELLSMVHDVRRFMLSHRFILEAAPLQTYISALVFSPSMSVVRQMYAWQMPRSVEVLGSAEEEWSACLQTLEGHSDSVDSVAFSPDGQLVASGSSDSTVRLWDVQTGAARGLLEGHSSEVNTVTFSPDGQLVASGADDGVRLWDAQTGATRGTLESYPGRVNTVVFSPDGQLVASGSKDGIVQLWNAQTGAVHGTLKGHSTWVNTVVFSPDCQLVASASWDGTARLWDTQTGAAHRTIEVHSSSHKCPLAFSPDSQRVASVLKDNTVGLWDAQTGAALGTSEGLSGHINTVVFLPDGRLVACGSGDGTVWLWDTQTGAACSMPDGHSDQVHTVVFSPDGQLVVSGSDDSTVRLWDAQTGAARGTLEGHSGPVSAMVLSPDGQLVASGSTDSTVRLWDMQTGTSRGTLEGHSGSVKAVVFSLDGELVASGSEDRTVRLWDMRTGAARCTLEGHLKSVTAVVFSPNGQLVASGSEDGTARLWDTRTGAARGTLEGHSHWVKQVVFSPDGQLVASGSWDSTVRLWDTRTGAAHGTLRGHSEYINAVVFSPNGQLLASGSKDKTVRLWDAQTGAARGTIKGHSGSVITVVFSPNGQLLASGSWDGTVRLWDAQTGSARGTLKGHTGWVQQVVFSPDGRLVASGSQDETVRLWDIASLVLTRCYNNAYHGQKLSCYPDGSLNVASDQRETQQSSTIPTFDVSRYSLDQSETWVMMQGRKLLWLPPGIRPWNYAIYQQTLVLGSGSGRMTFLRFKTSTPSQGYAGQQRKRHRALSSVTLENFQMAQESNKKRLAEAPKRA